MLPIQRKLRRPRISTVSNCLDRAFLESPNSSEANCPNYDLVDIKSDPNTLLFHWPHDLSSTEALGSNSVSQRISSGIRATTLQVAELREQPTTSTEAWSQLGGSDQLVVAAGERSSCAGSMPFDPGCHRVARRSTMCGPLFNITHSARRQIGVRNLSP